MSSISGLSTNTYLTSSQLFGKLDTDSSGSLSESEFVAGRPDDVSESQAETLFSSLAGSTGTISSTTFASMTSSSSSASGLSSDTFMSLLSATDASSTDSSSSTSSSSATSASDALSELFAAIDSNSDGSVSESELDTALKEISSALGISTDTASSTASSSSTTSTSSTSASDGASELYAAMDADGDGTVSESEFASALSGSDSASGPDGMMGPPPPPPPDGMSASGGSDSSSSTTTTASTSTSASSTTTASSSSTTLEALLAQLTQATSAYASADYAQTGFNPMASFDAMA